MSPPAAVPLLLLDTLCLDAFRQAEVHSEVLKPRPSAFASFSLKRSMERQPIFIGASSETAGNLRGPAVWGERGYREIVAKPAFRCKTPVLGEPQEPRNPFSQHCEFQGRNFFQKFRLRIRELYCSGSLGPDYCRIALTAIDFAIPVAGFSSSFLPPIGFLLGLVASRSALRLSACRLTHCLIAKFRMTNS